MLRDYLKTGINKLNIQTKANGLSTNTGPFQVDPVLKGACEMQFLRKDDSCRSPVMTEEEGNKVLFQVFCSFVTGRSSSSTLMRCEQSDAAKIVLDPQMNTKIKCRHRHEMNTYRFCRGFHLRKPFIPKDHERSDMIKSITRLSIMD